MCACYAITQKNCRRILTKFSQGARKRLDFDADSDHDADPGIFPLRNSGNCKNFRDPLHALAEVCVVRLLVAITYFFFIFFNDFEQP